MEKYDAAPPSTPSRLSTGVRTSSYASEPTTRMLLTEDRRIRSGGRREELRQREERIHEGDAERHEIGLENALLGAAGLPEGVERPLAVDDDGRPGEQLDRVEREEQRLRRVMREREPPDHQADRGRGRVHASGPAG